MHNCQQKQQIYKQLVEYKIEDPKVLSEQETASDI